MRAWSRSTLLSLLFGLAGLVLAPGAAWAATIVVTTTVDENGGSGGTGCALREAIMSANVDLNIGGCVRLGAGGADTITLQDSPDYTLSIPNVAGDENAAATGDLDVVGLLTIQVAIVGGWATVRGSPTLGDRIFHVQPSSLLLMSDLIIFNGDAGAGAGGGLLNENAQVQLSRVFLNGNQAGTGGFGLHNQNGQMILSGVAISNNRGTGDGAGIVSTGNLIVVSSTVDNHHATNAVAHGIRVDGGAATLANVTLSRNGSTGGTTSGAGLFAASGSGSVTLTNVTVADNESGIERHGGTVVVRNTLVAQHFDGDNCVGAITSEGHNLSDDTTCTTFTQPGDLPPNTDPQLGTLTRNGGVADTHAIPLGSPAVDAGNPAAPLNGAGGRCAETDQRGVSRPQDGDGANGPRCDIGAYELVRVRVNATDDAVDANPGDAICATAAPVRCTLRAAVQEANAVRTATIILLASPTPYTLSIAGTDFTAAAGDLDVTGNLTILGAGAATTIVDGGGIDRVFDLVFGDSTLEVVDLTIQNGNATGDGGGIKADDTRLVVRRSVIRGNRATQSGGGIGATHPVVTIIDSTISDNVAGRSGGGLRAIGGETLTIAGSTISGNQAGLGGGGIFTDMPGSVTNSTISNNSSATEGGALLSDQITASRVLTLANVTIFNNQAPAAAGLRELGVGTTALQNTIVANNGSANCIPARLRSDGHNLDTGNTCGFGQTGDLNNVHARLGPLQLNGGPTATHALLEGSPAIDGGNPAAPLNGFGGRCAATDQRGTPRPIDGNTVGGPRCDIGAYEAATCTTRPRVALGVVPGSPGRISVNVTAGIGNIVELRLHATPLSNIQVTIGSLVNQSGELVVPINAPTAQFTIRRANGTGAGTLQFDVVDGCGVWKSLAGGGPNAWPAGVSATGEASSTDPPGAQASATATLPGCSPQRPNVGLTTVKLPDGRLQTTLSAQSSPTVPTNSLSSVQIGSIVNAAVTINGSPVTAGQRVTLPAGTRQATLIVQRQTPPHAPDPSSGVNLVVTDACGDWKTFVGGGPDAW